MAPNDAEVLLVEDDADEAELALVAFKERNVSQHVTVVSDGEKAFAYLYSNGAVARLKLILLDIKLPRVDGLEVLKRIKSDERTRLIPVVMLTSSEQERDVRESYLLGANGYIVKPVGFEQFADAIQKLGVYWLQCNRLPS